MYLAKIHVTLKPTVNDPEGLTIRGALHNLGFQKVERVRSGKYIQVWLEEAKRTEAEKRVQEMCDKLLANPVIEDFQFELEEIRA